MTTDAKFRRAIYWSGWPVEVMKTDWIIAYKHVSVHELEHRFQLVEFGGRFFVELALTFGGCNSPTLYNMVSKLLIDLAGLDSGMDPRHSVQQLDDNCATASAGSKVLYIGVWLMSLRYDWLLRMTQPRLFPPALLGKYSALSMMGRR